MKKPELLAPAGNMECLYAAIEGGADAIYLAGKHYGARNYAGNFEDNELIEAIKYAHRYGVKIYVTVNTLVYDAEISSLIEYVRFLHASNVDAIIVQDIGMMSLIRQKFPNLDIHASTQMHIHNIEGVKLLNKLGVKRAVLARETDINLIRQIKSIDMELEIFVHGALCISYSGQCLMSSLIGGRSGNRGTCAQCCRQKYSLRHNGKDIVRDKYLLSTKDLNTLDNLKELLDIGVDSLKIEGRMKRPEYVYYVVSLYRKAIDNYLKNKENLITKAEIKDLKKLFNRNFTKGFLFNEDNNSFVNEERPNHIGIEIGTIKSCKNGIAEILLTDDLNKNDGIRILDYEDVGLTVIDMYINRNKVLSAKSGDIISIKINDNVTPLSKVVKTTDYNQLQTINELINQHRRKVEIIGNLEFINNRLKLTINDSLNEISISSPMIELSKNMPTSVDRISEQLNKLGGTIYKFSKLEINIPDNLFIPIKIINEMRRQVIEELDLKREYKIPFKEFNYQLEVKDFKKEQNLNILIHSIKDYEKIKNDNYHNIYIDDIDVFNKIEDDRKVLKIPRVITKFKTLKENLLVGELGSAHKYKNTSTDFSLNVTNAYSVAFLHSIGVKLVTLSYELNDHQIEKLISNYHKIYNSNPNLELIVEGYIEAMISKYNMIAKYNLNNENNYLIDRFNNKYEIKIKDDLMYIYNYTKRKLDNYDTYYQIGINNLRINL